MITSDKNDNKIKEQCLFSKMRGKCCSFYFPKEMQYFEEIYVIIFKESI